MAATGAEAALGPAWSVAMILCEEIMCLAPLATKDDKVLGLSLGMGPGNLDGRRASRHVDKLVAHIPVHTWEVELVGWRWPSGRSKIWYVTL